MDRLTVGNDVTDGVRQDVEADRQIGARGVSGAVFDRRLWESGTGLRERRSPSGDVREGLCLCCGPNWVRTSDLSGVNGALFR